MLVIGSADIAPSFGFPGQMGHPDIVEAERKVRADAKANGLAVYEEQVIDSGSDQDLLL